MEIKMSDLPRLEISNHKLNEIHSLLFVMEAVFMYEYENGGVRKNHDYLDYHMPDLKKKIRTRSHELYVKWAVDTLIDCGFDEKELTELFIEKTKVIKDVIKKYESGEKVKGFKLAPRHLIKERFTRIKGFDLAELKLASMYFSSSKFSDRPKLRNAAKNYRKWENKYNQIEYFLNTGKTKVPESWRL